MFISGSLQLQRWQGCLQLAYGLSPHQDAYVVLHFDGGPLPLRVSRTGRHGFRVIGRPIAKLVNISPLSTNVTICFFGNYT